MSTNKAPIYNMSIIDLNGVFDRYQTDYTNTFKHYGRPLNCNEEQLLYKDFKEIYQESIGKDEKEFAHPRYMREFLGAGILPSFKTTGELKYDSQMAINSPSRIGLSLSTFHHVIRNAGKEWGLYFDHSKLDSEFESVLSWMENPATHNRPSQYEGKKDQAIVDDIIKRFGELPAIPIRIPQRYAGPNAQNDRVTEIKNEFIPFKRVVYGDADSYTESYNIPAAALAWAIRPAGMSIQGRPDDSPMRPLLQTIVGIGREAGEKMFVLHRLAPDIYKNYDREMIASTLEDQKAWIKTAEIIEKIRGNEGQGYDEALNLIDKNHKKMNILSAYKIGVILYAITERMEKMEKDSKSSDAIKNILNVDYNGISFPELTVKLRNLSQCLFNQGIETEDKLRILKRDDVYEPDPKHYYRGRLEEIGNDQKDKLRAFFAQNPEYSDAITGFYQLIPKLKESYSSNDALAEYSEFVAEFCNHHMVTRFQSNHARKHHNDKTHKVLGLD